MSPLNPRLRAHLRASGPIQVPPPPPGLAARVLARSGTMGQHPARPVMEPIPAVALLLALVVLGAGLAIWNVPGQFLGPTPDFIEASQFIFTQLMP